MSVQFNESDLVRNQTVKTKLRGRLQLQDDAALLKLEFADNLIEVSMEDLYGAEDPRFYVNKKTVKRLIELLEEWANEE